jgi:hypothetical protein
MELADSWLTLGIAVLANEEPYTVDCWKSG